MQTLNSPINACLRERYYTLLIWSGGILLIDQMQLPVGISINNGFFPDQGGRNYEFIPTGITSIGGSELEI
jgi:hypothetical protein